MIQWLKQGRRAGRRPGWLGLLAAGVAAPALGQAPPPVPAPAVPPPAVVADELPTTPREAELEDRIRQLESMVERLSGRVEEMTVTPNQGTSATAAARGNTEGVGTPGGPTSPSVSVSAGGSAASRGPSTPPSSPRFNMPAGAINRPGKVKFGPGFEILSDDEEYQFQFHNLTQVDYRGYWDTPQANAGLYESTFGLPRQWWIFSGRLTKPFEYFVVPAFGFDNINLLDAFLNIHYDDRLQFKIGRFKTPFTYEFYNGPINGLINPERSLFFNNFALNRDVGMMAWGQLFEKTLDYAAMISNGSRNFYIDRNGSPAVSAYINWRPMGQWKDTYFENLNIGGSVWSTNQYESAVPQILRTNVATTGSSFFGVPFLGFNNGVLNSGPLAFWDLHAAWYYQQLSLIAEWGSGFQDYATTAQPFSRTRVPVQSFYVQAGYFITGETVAGRGQVKPLRDFNPRPGKFAPGAIELAARWSYLDVGREVFTAGLSDPSQWSNRAGLLDVGVNWYLSQYIKVYLGWQHSEFGDPVTYGPGRYQLTNDMLWTRFQIYF